MHHALAEKVDDIDSILDTHWNNWFWWFHNTPPLTLSLEGKTLVQVDRYLMRRDYVLGLLETDPNIPTPLTACGFYGVVVAGDRWNTYDRVSFFPEDDRNQGTIRPPLHQSTILDCELLSSAENVGIIDRFWDVPNFYWYSEAARGMMRLARGELEEICIHLPSRLRGCL